jgi:hypothetical protein
MLKFMFRVPLLVPVLSIGLFSVYAAAHVRSKPQEIVWTWEVRPPHPDAALPNVLLVGDSIARNYFPEVERRLAGKANVYLMASSICVGDPRLPKEIRMFADMEDVPFRVVHFNNGMHGFEYTESQYREGFPEYIAALRAIAPHAAFLWATTTPVRVDSLPGPTNARIDARNRIALQFVHGMMFDDEHALMEKHRDLYQDNVHFNAAGAALAGDKVAAMVLDALKKSHL